MLFVSYFLPFTLCEKSIILLLRHFFFSGIIFFEIPMYTEGQLIVHPWATDTGILTFLSEYSHCIRNFISIAHNPG